MKFKNFLLTEGKEIAFSIKELKDFLAGDFSEAYESYKKGNIIYRGFNYKEKELPVFFYGEPTKDRKSWKGLNIYTIIINEHSSWKNFPKRNLICALDRKIAFWYSTNNIAKIIFPKNGTKIGICPNNDIWWSFKKLSKNFSASDLNDSILGILYGIHPVESIKVINEKFLNSYKGLEKFCDKIDEIIRTLKFDSEKNLFLSSDGKYQIDTYIWKLFSQHFDVSKIQKGGKIIDQLVEIFSPEGFKVEKISNLKSKGELEVWFDSPYLALDEHNFNTLVENNEI